jgi:hypothetical protein
MQLKDIFANDVTRDIAPVVYFHEQDPNKVAEELSEYIITGGYPESDPRYRNIQSTGIHEQFVKLLRGFADELKKPGGPELPASWISGFYGSGKSSFAKLLGLALDGLELPDGRSLIEALLTRDDSPKAPELHQAWERVRSQVNPIAVVFDIGAVARDDEQIHSAVKREIQRRLRYCSTSNYVADHELKLELDGEWDRFLACAEERLGKPWSEAKDSQLAEEDFSEVMHVINPSRYVEPLSWFESRAGSQTGIGTSVDETTKAIADMLNRRASGKTLFIVVDEVSQYIYQNTNRMLKLQSFVSALGQRLKGKVWLLATGQQKLEDSDDASNIGKLKDRFPPKLRVHLAPSNIRDVVHKRLLKKASVKEPAVRSLFQQHKSDLKLYGYQCGAITEEDFLEVYPMLPGYVDLLMQITTSLRIRSTRAKSDDYAIRGLLQLLGELFREQNLGDQELGAMITLENIYEVQKSALDNDSQNTLTRIFSHEEVSHDPMLVRVAKVVAMLELIQEQEPTTVTLVSQCLYDRLGKGNQESVVGQALQKLRDLNLLSYSEKTGYKIQSSAGQEWARERDIYTVTPDAISEVVASKLKDLLGTVNRPRYKGNSFRWAAYYSDGRQRQDERLQVPNELAVVTVDFRYLRPQEERNSSTWIQNSDTQNLRDRLVWVVGKLDDLESQVRELARSRQMVEKYQNRRQSLPTDRQRLLSEEQNRCETLESKVKEAIARVFVEGEIYFRGRVLDKQLYGNSFGSILEKMGESLLLELYSRYVDIAVTPIELKQLLEANLSGPSHKFMKDGLSILELDAGKYIPSCSGEVPTRIGQFVIDENGISGTALLNYFGGPPYGHPVDVVRACLAGLLRAGKIQIRTEDGSMITSVRDAGSIDMFTKDRDLKRADILPPSDKGISPRDRIAICTFFKDSLGFELDRENDAIADAVFKEFPNQARRLRELGQQYNRLPNRPDLPETLVKLQQALEKCVKVRQVEPTLIEVKRHLDDLRDGIQQLGILETDVTDDAISAVRRAVDIQENQVTQLKQIDQIADIQKAIDSLEAQLALERPWRDIRSMESQLQEIEQHYRAIRLSLIEQQEQRAESIRNQVKRRPGFVKLHEEKASFVLHPIQEAIYDTTLEALDPTLLELRDTAKLRLQEAADQSNVYLDNVLSQGTDQQVVQVPLNLRGREVSTPEEVELLVNQLRDNLLAQLEGKTNIRIRLI